MQTEKPSDQRIMPEKSVNFVFGIIRLPSGWDFSVCIEARGKIIFAFFILPGVLAAVGASNLQYVDLNSSRNLVVFGISLFLGLSFPAWIVEHAEQIKTGKSQPIRHTVELI